MSSSSSYGSVDSEDDTTSWLVSSEDSIDDEDELTLLNGDEENDENSTTFEAFIRLSMRLKKQYNLREASVALERCDKIWDTMQLLKSAQTRYTTKEEVDETDEGNERDNRLKSSEWTSDSVSSSVSTGPVPYIKYQPTQGNGNNALPNFYLSVKKQTKIYNCGTCGKIYNEKRAFRIHEKRDHGISLPGAPQIRKRSNNSETQLTRPKTPQSTDTSSVDGDKASRPRMPRSRNLTEAPLPCPVCGNLYAYKASLRKHAKEAHGVDIPMEDLGRPKTGGEKKKLETRTTSNKVTSVKNAAKQAKTIARPDITYVYTRPRMNDIKSYLYVCIICHKECFQKRELRTHLSQCHEINIPKGPEGSLNGLFIKDIESAREYLRKLRQNGKLNEMLVPLKTERAGPKSSKTSGRPKRACAVNTTYTEPTKEEEDILQYHEVPSDRGGQSLSSSRTTKCFLCRRTCVDMIHHLKDYHRISKPDSVLPLNEPLSGNPIPKENNNGVEKLEAKEKDKEKESSSPAQRPSEQKSPRKKTASRKSEQWKSLDEKIKGLFRNLPNDKKGSKTVQCLMCMTKYSKMWALKFHLSNKLKDGVVQMHEPYPYVHSNRWTSSKKGMHKKKETAQDPLKLDDTSTVDSESSSAKHRSSYSDESSSTSEVTSAKRRKIEFPEVSEDIGKSSDTGSDESEEETMRKLKKNSRYKRADEKVTGGGREDKSPDQRHTRDSSDRDSGIGINITIKKRNNSYEVVERDNCCGGNKAKGENDYEASKDDNVTSLDSLSDITNSDHRSGDKLAVDSRTRDVFDPLDCSVEQSINKSTPIPAQHQDDDDVTIVEYTVPRTVEQMSKQQNARCSHKASRKIPGSMQWRET